MIGTMNVVEGGILAGLLASNVMLYFAIMKLHSVLFKLYLGGILTGRFDVR